MGRADFTEIGIVYRKDMIEFFRDYRSLLVMIFVPVVIYPLMLILPAIVASKIKSEIFQRNSTVALVGDYGPLADQLRKTKSLTIVKASIAEDCMNSLAKGKIDLVVKFPDDFEETFTTCFNHFAWYQEQDFEGEGEESRPETPWSIRSHSGTNSYRAKGRAGIGSHTKCGAFSFFYHGSGGNILSGY